MIKLLRRLFWTLTGRCRYCGGWVWEYDWKRGFCLSCEKKN